ncbi:MAG: hypothetical protein PW843_28630 [Azospirillaceae bacterium]|nr:hypothetical protein [Azospirillaceae bacterium]
MAFAGWPVFLDEGGGGHQRVADGRDLAHLDQGIGDAPGLQGHVITALDEIVGLARHAAQIHLHGDARVFLAEGDDGVGHVQRPDPLGHDDGQLPGRLGDALGDLFLDARHLFQDALAELVIGTAGLRQADGPGGADQQPRGQVVFQVRYLAGHQRP